MYQRAYRYSDEIIFYFDSAGNKYVASGGSLAWRLNNPGLVRSHSHFSRSNGSIGNCGSYAIFSDPQKGREALSAWLRSKKYYESTLKTIAEHYQEDAPDVFLNQLTSFTKIPFDRKVKYLTEQEFERLIIGIEKLCGYASTGNEKFSLLPKIIAKIEFGNDREDSYIIGDSSVLSKEEALQWVLAHQLDAVIIYEQDNRTYLRSRPRHCFQKIKIHTRSLPPSVLESGLSERHVIHQLAYADAILDLDSIDSKTIASYTKSRENHYEQEFLKIKHITILDPDPCSNWKHDFCSECYQAVIRDIIRRYKKNG